MTILATVVHNVVSTLTNHHENWGSHDMTTAVLIVELEIAPGRKVDFLARAREHRINVLNNEPGCQRFDLLSPQEGDDTVFLYEVYADQDALETHFNTRYVKEYLEDTNPMIANRKRILCTLVND